MLRNVCVKANVPDSGATVRESVLEGLLPQPSPGLRRIAARLCDTVWLALASYRLLARTIVHTGLFSLSLSLSTTLPDGLPCVDLRFIEIAGPGRFFHQTFTDVNVCLVLFFLYCRPIHRATHRRVLLQALAGRFSLLWLHELGSKSARRLCQSIRCHASLP